MPIKSRRADGTVMTQDCPVGLRAVRLKLARLTAGAFAMAATLFYAAGLRRTAPEVAAPHLMGEAMSTAGTPVFDPPTQPHLMGKRAGQ